MENKLKKQVIEGTIWKFLERLFAQGVTLVVSIIIARILSPEDYGVVSLVTIFFAFANAVISGGLNTALIQKKNADREDYDTVYSVSLITATAVYLILFFCAPLIANIYRNDLLVSIIRIMGISLPVYALKSIVCAYVSSELQFKKFFFATFGGTVVSAFIGIFMAVKGFGPWALVAQQVSNTFIDTLILFISTKLKLRFRITMDRFKSLFSYGSRILVSSLIGIAYSKLNPLFIGLKYTASDLSYYTKGESFPSALSSSITNTVSSVLFPFMSKCQDDREKLLQYTRRFIRLTSYFVFPMMMGLFAVSDTFIEVFLTHKWIDASFYIKIFCIDCMFGIIATGNCETIKAMGRSDIFLKMEIIKKTLYFLIIGLFIVFSDSPRQLAYSVILCTFVQIVVNSYPNTKLISYRIIDLLSDISLNLITSVAMCVSVIFIGRIELSSKLLLLVVQCVSGTAIYLFLSFVTKNENLRYTFDMVQNILHRKKESVNDR